MDTDTRVNDAFSKLTDLKKTIGTWNEGLKSNRGFRDELLGRLATLKARLTKIRKAIIKCSDAVKALDTLKREIRRNIPDDELINSISDIIKTLNMRDLGAAVEGVETEVKNIYEDLNIPTEPAVAAAPVDGSDAGATPAAGSALTAARALRRLPGSGAGGYLYGKRANKDRERRSAGRKTARRKPRRTRRKHRRKTKRHTKKN